MKAEIISIGDELLIGQVINTNAAKIGELLNLSGIRVVHVAAVPDEHNSIFNSLIDAGNRADLVIVTGGLGPTRDDITKKVLCDFFRSSLIQNHDVLNDVKVIFERKGRPLTDMNRKQAEVPDKCLVIRNTNGTAPGMWFKEGGKIYVSIPGVPYEALEMVENYIIPKLKLEYNLPHIFHYTIHTQGIGESYLAEIISDWEDSLKELNIKLAYLPSIGTVRLRLSGFGENEARVKQNVMSKKDELMGLIGKYVYAFEEFGSTPPLIQKLLGEILLLKNKKIALAESCTGGYISHLMTSVPGASAYFNGCVIPYHNEFKNQILNVPDEIFETDGAVSESCVSEMAMQTLKKFNSDYSIAVSGIAGPSGGTTEKPVGTVWVAWASREKIKTEKFVFSTNRSRNIHLTAINALEGLRRLIVDGF